MTTPRKIAKENGDQFFHRATPCERCGGTKRYVSSAKCVACLNRYQEKYREENREAIVAKRAEYYKENHEAFAARDAEYYKKNREAIKARQRKYNRKNSETIRAKISARNAHIRSLLEKASKEGPFEIESNNLREIAAARGELKYLEKKECKKHPGVFERYTADNKCPTCANVKEANRRAIYKEAEVPLTPEERKEVDALYAEARRLSEVTGNPFHVDHILPMQKGGIHHPINLRILPGSENCSKGANIHWEEITPAIASIHLLHRKPKLSKQTINKLKRIKHAEAA